MRVGAMPLIPFNWAFYENKATEERSRLDREVDRVTLRPQVRS